MLRHIVLIRFNDGVTEADRAAYRAAVEELGRQPEVRGSTCGDNVGSGPNHHDFAVVMDFDDTAAFRRYINSDAHRVYVADWAKPMVKSLAAIQHELPGT